MQAARKFWRLRLADKSLVLRTVLPLALVQLGLATIGYRKLSPLLVTRLPLRATSPDPARLAWAVRMAAKCVPGSACLAQALTLHHLLSRAGHDSVVRIGVAQDGQSDFSAHAWVIHDGVVLIGQPALNQHNFAKLTDIKLHAP